MRMIHLRAVIIVKAKKRMKIMKRLIQVINKMKIIINKNKTQIHFLIILKNQINKNNFKNIIRRVLLEK